MNCKSHKLLIALPKILLGRRRSGGLSQTIPSNHPSSQEIYHKSDEYPPIPAMDHCKNGWRVQCAQRDVCCTAKQRNKEIYQQINLLRQTEHLHILRKAS